MSGLNFELPNGITLNSVESKEYTNEEGILLRKISCPYCAFFVKAFIADNYGRYSGKVIINDNHEVWQSKLASDPIKSKQQLLEMFNKKVRDHIDKCNTRSKKNDA